MTSTPTLAAAQDVVNSGLAVTHGLSAEQINSNITVGYAITYVFGLVGLILFMRLFPRLMGIDLPAEAAALAKKMKISEDDEDDEFQVGNKGLPAVRVYKASNGEIHTKTLDDLKFLQATGCVILKIKRDGHTISPGDNTSIETGDAVAVVGHFNELLKAAALLGGPEIQDEMLAEFPIETHQVVVINRQMVGKTVRESGVINKFSCFMTKFTRSGTELPLNLDLKLEKGDVLVLTGIKERLELAAELLGHAERPIHETDLVTFAFGIVIGIVIGSLTVKLGSVPIGIGMAGGLLVTGLLVGHLRAQHWSFGRVPRAARFILMEMGILFFLAGVGLRAGHGLIEGLQSVGIQVFISGIAITLIPVICGFMVGRYILKMHPAILMGAITGSMTSTPALVIVNNTAKSSLPALGYTGAYAFANIILTLAGQMIMLF
jgi:putative transport protein